ncbi:MAG: sugar phosphate isomerase/epimerase, partial [Opitutales bacterium]|nr:sugar phosphate isomerase/epimerase [Opitutales bacterium]
MARLVTLFTGQWADLSLAELAPKVKEMGFDGVELACWGDHFDVNAALTEPNYIAEKWALLEANGLTCEAISTHLVGQ